MTDLEEDIQKCKFYNEFFAQNKDLYQRNLTEYWRQARIYYEQKTQKECLKTK